MSKPSSPIRIDSDLYAAAAEAARLMSRSITQQVTHWARIGRELEASAEVSVGDVVRVLQGDAGYDDLRDAEQALVRVFWQERMAQLQQALRLDHKLSVRGRAYAELDDEGRVVVREPGESAETEAG